MAGIKGHSWGLKEDFNRIEVWYANGDFKAYPDVNPDSLDFNNEQGLLGFEFRSGHAAIVKLDNVNFIEVMYHDGED